MHNRVAQRISNVETRMELSFRRCFSHDREISSAGRKRKTLYKIRVSSKRATPCFPLCILEERKHSKRGKKATSYATRKIKVWLSVEGGTCLGCFNTLVSDGANIQLYASHSAWKYARARGCKCFYVKMCTYIRELIWLARLSLPCFRLICISRERSSCKYPSPSLPLRPTNTNVAFVMW